MARAGVASGRSTLRDLYDRADHRPLWTTSGRPTVQATAAVAVLTAAADRGLRPERYDASSLGSEASVLERADAGDDDERVARFDVGLSRAVMRLLADLHAGRVDPRALRFHLPETHARIDLVGLTLDVSRANDVSAAIASVEPRYAGYAALVAALARYRVLAADPMLAAARIPLPPLRPGDASDRVPALRRMLAAFGDLDTTAVTESPDDSTRLTAALSVALARFQRRHGLAPNGVLDKETGRQLRVPLTDRVRQIELALERWRWLPDVPPERYAVVNVPAFRLVVFEHDSTAHAPVLRMNVIVGQAGGRHGTPIFAGLMDEVVFRPYWDVPRSIARKELVPLLQRDRTVVTRDGFEIVRGGETAPVLSFTTANLALVTSGELRLRQRPGPANALGAVKFVFPNSHSVYLHGTPAQQLFARTRRDFSHGCIRVADPVALAEFVLRGQEGWNRAAIDSAVLGERTLHVLVTRPVSVYVLYATVVAAPDGTVEFFADLYGHDAALARTLRRSDSAGPYSSR